MTNKTAARRYARALFDVLVKERGNLPQIEQELSGVVDLFATHPTLGKALLTPAVPASRKRAVVAELAARAGVSPVLTKLLVLLAERDRLALLPDLLAAYRERLLDHQQIVSAEVITAAPLAGDQVNAIERSLAEVTRRAVSLRTRVDEAVIGGMVARVGGTVYDGSVARQLERMKQRLQGSR